MIYHTMFNENYFYVVLIVILRITGILTFPGSYFRII